MISPQRCQEIIDALRRGTVPRRSLDAFAVALEPFEEALDQELGRVHPTSFMLRRGERPVILLAGRSWAVTRTSWRERIAWVEPTEEEGRSQWLGTGQPLHFDLCRAVRRVLS
ncbi:MAG: hypothetical protein GY856_01000, partial [bacterium]|nr:hypothetical protein [bacterium]